MPRNVQVERSVEIDRPAATVFSVLNGYRHFQAWSPWADRDPDALYTLSGPDTGVGARLSWSGDPRLVGTGWQEIVSSVPDRQVGMHLDFEQQGVAESYFSIEEMGRGVRLTWAFHTDLLEGQGWLGGILARYLGLFFDRWIGTDYEIGLTRLKAYVESLPSADFSDLDVVILDLQPMELLYVRLDDITAAGTAGERLAAAYREITGFMAAHGIEREGQPLTIMRSMNGPGLSLEAALPASAASAEPTGRVRAGRLPGGHAARAVHLGSHAGMASTYDKLAAWLAIHGYEQGRVTWEQYVSDPARTPPGERVTHIYALLADAP